MSHSNQLQKILIPNYKELQRKKWKKFHSLGNQRVGDAFNGCYRFRLLD